MIYSSPRPGITSPPEASSLSACPSIQRSTAFPGFFDWEVRRLMPTKTISSVLCGTRSKKRPQRLGAAEAVLVGGYPQSKGKSSADLLKELPCGAAVVALEKVAIVTVKKSQGEKRRKHHRR